MLYPLYVFHDEGSAWGGQFPDMPGCFTAADDLNFLPEAAQEAVLAHYGFDEEPLPDASTPERWMHHSDYQGGFWMMVDLDISKIRPKSIRLNISLPDILVQKIDREARRRGQSRSAFLAKAATREISTLDY